MKTTNSKNRIALYSSLTIAVLGAGLASVAQAGSANANMLVSADVAASCAISANPLDFGSYDPVVANAVSALAGGTTVDVACTNGAAASITLSQGLNADEGSSADAPLRRLSNGTSTLSYALFHDSARTQVWGESVESGSNYIGTGFASSIDVYGLIPAGQAAVTAGTYTDTVVATINF